MSAKGLKTIFLSIWLLASSAIVGHVLAQEAQPAEPGLKDVLTDLLDSLEDPPPAAAAAGKRLPFGRAEIQLSFAPLVRDTAPAVVKSMLRSRSRPCRPSRAIPSSSSFSADRRPKGRSRRSALASSSTQRLRRHQLSRHPRRGRE